MNWSRPVQCLLTHAANFYRYYKALLSICLIVRTAISNRLGWCYKKEVGGNDMKTLERLITLAVCTRTKQISLIYVSNQI